MKCPYKGNGNSLMNIKWIIHFMLLEQFVGLPIIWLLRCSTGRAMALSRMSGPSDASCEFTFLIVCFTLWNKTCTLKALLHLFVKGRVVTLLVPLVPPPPLYAGYWFPLTQVYPDVRQSSIWDSWPKGDVQMYKGSSVQPALHTFPGCTETHLGHLAEKPQWQTHPRSNPQPWIFHQSKTQL